MSDKGQEGKSTQEQEDKFIDEFKRISQELILRGYETKNRAKILSSSFLVRDTFDKKWTEIIGSAYFQPITTAPVELPMYGKNVARRFNPASTEYKTEVTFTEVTWQKTRKKIGKKYQDFFNLTGIEAVTKSPRPIFQNLSYDRLVNVLGESLAIKITKEAKTEPTGNIKGPLDIWVEGFWEVQFAPMKDPNDPKDVRLTWENQCLIIKRMTPVVLPGFYLENADHATRDTYEQSPERGRVKVGTIQEFPYTVLREATMEEYVEMRATGDRIMREKRQKVEEA
jgi:hypothetical protein